MQKMTNLSLGEREYSFLKQKRPLTNLRLLEIVSFLIIKVNRLSTILKHYSNKRFLGEISLPCEPLKYYPILLPDLEDQLYFE